MGAINSYKDFIVWQKSIQLVKEIYLITEKFPRTEQFGITSQMRRAVISIPSNIAEGFGRRTYKDQDQFYLTAYGSSLELETQLIISIELEFMEEARAKRASELLQEVIKMLNKMTSKSRNN